MATKRFIKNAYNSSIHNSQMMDITQMSTNMKMDKQIVMYLNNKILHSNKIGTTDTCSNDGFQNHCLEF